MISLIVIASGFCLLCAAALLLTKRRRHVGFSGLENVSVSRQWLIEHQADDPS